jgi:PBP1b-binding outer membrane lipoprotein LpoB
VKKTIAAGALILSLFVVGCNNNDATPAPATEAPAAAVESMAAEVEDAVESMVADAVESPAA